MVAQEDGCGGKGLPNKSILCGRVSMRYIYYIAAIFFIALGFVLYQFFSGNSADPGQPAIVINDRVITTDAFARMKPPHDESRQDFINSIITKELLIQEAQRAGIDKEESFRQSVQSFYEQSLVKVLMDRKFASLNISISDEEVNKYFDIQDKKVELTVYTAASSDDLNAGRARVEKMRASFEDLSREMKGIVLSLKKGEKSVPFKSGNNYIAIMLNDTQPGGVKRSGISKDEIRKLMADSRREQLIAEWMDGLRKKANIKVPISGTNGG
jgi:parvulin-like peptidyl-prolyl isomerase